MYSLRFAPQWFTFTSVYICYCRCCSVRLTVNHLRLLFWAFLHHSLIQKLFTKYSEKTQTVIPRSSMATAGMETTRGPTYSMTRAIWATPWQEGFICPCHCLLCHYSPLTVEVTRHMDRPLQQWPHRWACQRECNLSVDTFCKAHGVLDPCACSNHTERAWHAWKGP